MRYTVVTTAILALIGALSLAGCEGATDNGGQDVVHSVDTSIPSIEDVIDVSTGNDIDPKVDLVAPDIPSEDIGVDPDVMPDTGQEDVGEEPDVLVPDCEEGEACDDGDPCTHADLCAEGVCVGTAFACDDGLSCTGDVCDGEGGCTYPLRGGHCLIDGECFEDGGSNPDNACQACQPPLAAGAWSAGPAVACDDGDACTEGDTCRSGLCTGSIVDCGEAAPCHAVRCDSTTGCVDEPLSDVACDDGDACTVGDACVAGACVPGTLADCGDSNPCTDDVCDSGNGACVHTANTASCNDYDICTQLDQCVNGACVGSSPQDCDDGNLCTDDGCHPIQGCITVNNTDPCEDGDPCSVGDRCVAGDCAAGPGVLECAGDNPCVDYACVAGLGCVEVPNDNPCSDGDACTVGDRCAAGLCVPGAEPLNCSDGILCSDDLCDPDTGCYWEDNTVACDDDDPCTVGDACGGGSCQPGTEALTCPSDGDPCTFNRCESGEGCVAEPLTGPTCEDGDPCTVGDVCDQGTCIAGADELACVDDNDCTDNYCEAGVGCVAEPLTGPSCDDGNFCTDSDECVGGTCLGDEIECYDANSCTNDSCDPATGCVFEASNNIYCWPQVVIDYPPRGVTIADDTGFVTVSGRVWSYSGGEIVTFRFDGEEASFDETGAFSIEMDAVHGLNMIRLFAEDDLGVQRDVRQSFQYSESYWPMDPANPEAARLDDGIVVFVSDEVVDDGDRSDTDDLATIMEMMFAGLDLNDMIPDPAAEVSQAGCDYEVRVRNVRHDPPSIELFLLEDALRLVLRVDDFSANADADADDWWCPGVDVDITADRITVDAVVSVVMVNGQIQAEVVSNDVSFQNLEFSDSNWLIDVLIGLFEGTIEDELESAFEDAIEDLVPELLQDVLGQLALSQEFDIPAFLPGMQPATISLDSTLSDLDIAPDGIVIGMAPTVMAAEHLTPYTPLGAIARGTCLTGVVPSFVMPRLHAIDAAIFDDVLNEIFYAVYMGGVLEMSLDEQTLDQDLSG